MIKKCLIGLAIYTLVAVGVMCGMIYFHNSKTVDEDWSLSTNVTKGKPSSEYDTYNQNDLLINNVDVDYENGSYNMIQIEGLKDKTLENNINDEIKKSLYDCIDKVSAKTEVNYAYATSYANFGNVLSIYISAYGGEYPEEVCETRYLNYNLTNGEKLKLSDLFVENANLARVYYECLYNQFAIDDYYEACDEFYMNNTNDNEFFEGYLPSVNEEELLATVKKYLAKGDDVGFCFSEKYLFLDAPENYTFYRVPLYDLKDIVNIYDKYKTTFSIFERNDIGAHGVFNYCSYYPNGTSEKFGFIGDNIFIDFTTSDGLMYMDDIETLDPAYFTFYDKIADETRSGVDELIRKAKADKNNFYIIFDALESNLYFRSDYNDESGKWLYYYGKFGKFTTYTNYYVIPKDVYKNEYRDKLYEAYRKGYLSYAPDKRLEWNYDEEGNLLEDKYAHKDEVTKFYNFITGEEIKNYEEIFVEGTDIDSVLYPLFRNSFIEYGYGSDDLVIYEAYKHSDISFDVYGIQIDSPDYPDLWCSYSYDLMPEELLTIF